MMMVNDEQYMQRCLQLAGSGAGYVTPNPMVGAILVHHNRIIGEGYHQQYGMPHAEVNCIASVKDEDRHLIKESVLYVSLEPCVHFGKTPPCSDLIIQHQIPEVVVGCRDPFAQVNGKGVEKMRAAGIRVTFGVLEKECQALNKRFFTFHTQHRPYVVLKWAQSTNGAIANADGTAVQISNAITNRFVHRWRSEEAAILVGTRTAKLDNPSLTTRLWPGKNPIRLVIDREMKLFSGLQLFDKRATTIVFNEHRHTIKNREDLQHIDCWFFQVKKEGSMVQQIMDALFQLGIQSVLVEGGAQTLQSFIDEDKWDEARVIINDAIMIPSGIIAPRLTRGVQTGNEKFISDRIEYFSRSSPITAS